MNRSNPRQKKKKTLKINPSVWLHNKVNYRHIKLFHYIRYFVCLILGIYRFPLGHIQARVWSSRIVIWVTQYLQMLHVHFGPNQVFMNSVNFGREVKSFTASGREFQILGPSVLSLLIFLKFLRKVNKNQLEIVVEATYGLHS